MPREAAWFTALGKMTRWTAPGPDGIQGYWYKVFPKTTSVLKGLVWEIVDGGRRVPGWMVKGRTVMIPKDGNSTGEPDKFRPITCLNTMYKLLTGMLTEVLYEHVMTQGLLPDEQKALRKGRRGCLDALGHSCNRAEQREGGAGT
jgi:hypothetical protein